MGGRETLTVEGDEGKQGHQQCNSGGDGGKNENTRKAIQGGKEMVRLFVKREERRRKSGVPSNKTRGGGG